MNKFYLLILATSAAFADPLPQPAPQPTKAQLRNQTNQATNEVNNQINAANNMNQSQYANANQQYTAQQNTGAANYEGADQAGKMGNAQMILGAALTALGSATACTGPTPPCVPLLAAGMFQNMMGGKSYDAQRALNGVGNTAWGYRDDLNGVSPYVPPPGGGIDNGSINFTPPGGSSTGNGVVDLSNPGNPSVQAYLDAVTGAGGVSLTDVEKYLGYNTGDIRSKYPGISDAEWDSAMKNAAAAFANPNGPEARALQGMTGKFGDATKAIMSDGSVGYGDGTGASVAGADGAGKAANGKEGPSLADLLKGAGNGDGAAGTGFDGNGLEANGKKEGDGKGRKPASLYGEKSIFVRVNEQYLKQRPGLLSVDYFIRNKLKEQPQELRGYIK